MENAVLVTGASRGIGREIAKGYARRGEHLVVVSRSTDELQELKQDLETEWNIDVKVISMDLSEPSSADRLFKRLKSDEIHVHTLINNAGFGLIGRFSNNDPDREQDLLELNVVTLTRLTRLFIEPMLEQGQGRIMNVASTASFMPGPYMSSYYASKAYVLSFTEGIAEELVDENIKVSALCPGVTRTGFQEEAGLDESGFLDSIPRFAIASARDVAEYGIEALERGKVVAIHGWLNWLMVVSMKFMPRFLKRKIVGGMQAPPDVD